MEKFGCFYCGDSASGPYGNCVHCGKSLCFLCLRSCEKCNHIVCNDCLEDKNTCISCYIDMKEIND